jgi:hypothetical protein
VARPSLRLTEQFPLTAIPTDTVKAVKESGLVEHIEYRPSRERELLSRAEPLSNDEQQWVLKVSADQQQLQDPTSRLCRSDRQALIHRRVRIVWSAIAPMARSVIRACAAQFRTAAGDQQNPAPELQIPQPGLPEDGHESRTWQAGARHPWRPCIRRIRVCAWRITTSTTTPRASR